MSSLSKHYHQMVGLNDDWIISDVELDVEAQKLTLVLEFVGNQVTCPECGVDCSMKDHALERTPSVFVLQTRSNSRRWPTNSAFRSINHWLRSWRHLDAMQFQTVLKACVPRSACESCGVKNIKVPWAEKHSRFTLLFEAFAIEVLRAARSIDAAALLLSIDWSTAQNIMKRAVERGLKRRSLDEVVSRGGKFVAFSLVG